MTSNPEAGPKRAVVWWAVLDQNLRPRQVFIKRAEATRELARLNRIWNFGKSRRYVGMGPFVLAELTSTLRPPLVLRSPPEAPDDPR